MAGSRRHRTVARVVAEERGGRPVGNGGERMWLEEEGGRGVRGGL